jgi:hypothetical protein
VTDAAGDDPAKTAPAEQVPAPDDPEESRPGRPGWLNVRPPANARCAACGSADLAARPTFSTGSGVASRPSADDVYCRRCSFQGRPRFVPSDTDSGTAQP